MSGIHVTNKLKEEHSKNTFYIGRPTILGNPYTHIKDKKTLAKFITKDRDEAIDNYASYFDVMYSGNIEFKKKIDEIYNLFKSGEDVYLECYCKPLRCHGDIIVDKLRKRLIKEKLKNETLQ